MDAREKIVNAIASIYPVVMIGDEDSIDLTNYQRGYKAGLEVALLFLDGGKLAVAKPAKYCECGGDNIFCECND